MANKKKTTKASINKKKSVGALPVLAGVIVVAIVALAGIFIFRSGEASGYSLKGTVIKSGHKADSPPLTSLGQTCVSSNNNTPRIRVTANGNANLYFEKIKKATDVYVWRQITELKPCRGVDDTFSPNVSRIGYCFVAFEGDDSLSFKLGLAGPITTSSSYRPPVGRDIKLTQTSCK